MRDIQGYLMIEPTELPTKEAKGNPVIDTYTRKAAWLVHHAKITDYYMGVHQCRCGATSDSADRWWNGRNTNSLAVHYLALHREEVPEEELRKLQREIKEELEPSFKDIWGYDPPKVKQQETPKTLSLYGYIRDFFRSP